MRWNTAGAFSQSKWHYHWFEKSHVCFEGCFVFVAFFNPDVIVSCSDVQFSEQTGILDLVDFFLQQWDRTIVRNRDRVDFSVIDYQALFSILLSHKEGRGADG
jgi:hypothetical protein